MFGWANIQLRPLDMTPTRFGSDPKDDATLPVACELTPGEMVERKAGLLPGLVARVVSSRPVENGYVFSFAATETDILSDVAKVVDAERRCCPFLQFVIRVAPAGGPVELEVTGPSETREFLDSVLG